MLKKFLWKILHHLYRPAEFKRDNIKNILVIRMNRIGDMICTIPLLKTLKREFPDANLTVLAEETNADVIKNVSYIDKVLVYKKSEGISGIYRNRIFNLMKTLKGMNFDITIGVKGGFSSNLAIAVFLSRAPYRVGYISSSCHPLEMLYSLPVNRDTDIIKKHQVDQCLNLLGSISITPERFVRDITLEIPETFKIRLKKFLHTNNINAEKDRIVILNISNDSFNTRWPLENFTQLINKLMGEFIKCIITSSPADSTLARNLANTCSGNKPVAVLYETPHIMDFAAVAEIGNLLICHDSGAMHIGASVKTETLVLVGRGITPEIWGPYGNRHKCLLKTKINDITVDEVFYETLGMLNTGKWQSSLKT